ncbi:MAG: hypothetical protein K5987_03330, partial [Lachnospiraceae bacterium]|nr:hypothetical protein [Lachnospiraceae bacterium]
MTVERMHEKINCHKTLIICYWIKKWMEYPFCFGEDPRDVNEYNTYAERMQGGNKILRAKLICSNGRTACPVCKHPKADFEKVGSGG